MAYKKYINIKDVVKLTGQSDDEIRKLAQTGVLHAHKARRGHWRLNVDTVEKFFEIQINCPPEQDEKPVTKTKASKHVNDIKFIGGPTNLLHSTETCLIINEKHYQEVLQRICTAKTSIKIMTADFKRFNLKPTGSQGKDYKDGTPFIKYLMSKAVQGVSVRIICSRPSTTFTEEWKEYYRQMMNPTLFKYKYCNRNHAKIVIVDDRFAYIGSANVTPAGLGQGIFTPGNFEAGIITEELSVISSAKELFSMIWNDNYCTNCHRADNCTD